MRGRRDVVFLHAFHPADQGHGGKYPAHSGHHVKNPGGNRVRAGKCELHESHCKQRPHRNQQEQQDGADQLSGADRHAFRSIARGTVASLIVTPQRCLYVQRKIGNTIWQTINNPGKGDPPLAGDCSGIGGGDPDRRRRHAADQIRAFDRGMEAAHRSAATDHRSAMDCRVREIPANPAISRTQSRHVACAIQDDLLVGMGSSIARPYHRRGIPDPFPVLPLAWMGRARFARTLVAAVRSRSAAGSGRLVDGGVGTGGGG